MSEEVARILDSGPIQPVADAVPHAAEDARIRRLRTTKP
jgi:hypothetical protein